MTNIERAACVRYMINKGERLFDAALEGALHVISERE